LEGKQTADVVVIGSGIAGLSTAYELAGRGRKVIVVDRGKIGRGMTARTTAHLASALDDGYADLIAARGLETAQCVYQAQAAAIDRIEAIQAKENIECDFRRVDGYLMLAPETSEKDFDDELKACHEAGVTVDEIVEPTSLHSSDSVRSLRFRNQARIHPLKYLSGLARGIKRSGGILLANTAVVTVSEEKTSVVVETNKGTIRAIDVVIATNSPIAGDVAIHTKQAPYRTYAIAAQIPRGSLADALYWDTLDPYHYVRLQPNSESQDIIIIGGEDHKSGEADDGEARFEALERWGRARVPDLGRITHRWSGQVMEPADYIGLAGRNGEDKHRYLATGDSGQGMTNGVIAAILISDLITEGSSPWAEVFDPDRAMTKNVTEFLSENLTALKSFAEYLTAGEIRSVEKLRPGEGGVYRSGLKKIAACRDRRGNLHVQSATCTHMGCVVHWNSLEQCWDCPCHGSQFSAAGQVFNGPAVSPLEPVEQKEKLTAAE
jgi:glycine/D-amino acid oxidase-like deaminating enzyme/nitrite reductase/ring-hydroxylating ferredoxin subunit